MMRRAATVVMVGMLVGLLPSATSAAKRKRVKPLPRTEHAATRGPSREPHGAALRPAAQRTHHTAPAPAPRPQPHRRTAPPPPARQFAPTATQMPDDGAGPDLASRLGLAFLKVAGLAAG